MATDQILRKVKVEGGDLGFSAAHFVTYGGKCERLHGHNYAVLVEIEGMLNADSMVLDFTIMKKHIREICHRLDHRFLLPLYNRHMEINAVTDAWELRFQGKCYVFPRADVVELPLDNSTAECLAEYICKELKAALSVYDTAHLQTLMVGVSEAPTQMAYYHMSLQAYMGE